MLELGPPQGGHVELPIIYKGLIYVVDIRNGLYVLRYTGTGAKTVRDIEFLEGSSNVVLLRWNGCLATYKDAPFLNEAHADGIQRFWFRLGGDYGLDVLHGTPSSRRIDCTTFEPLGPYEAAETPSWDALSYQARHGPLLLPLADDERLRGNVP